MIDVIDLTGRTPVTRQHHTARQPVTTHRSHAAVDRPRIPKLASPSSVLMLMPLRLFLAAGWVRAGVEKLIEPQWWTGQSLRMFLVEQNDAALPFFRPVMEHAIAPAAVIVAFVVMVTQLGCGLAIGVGKRMRLALRWVFVLNVTFILAGRVNPSAFYLVMQAVLLLAIADGTIGENSTTPSRWTIAAAGASAALGISVLPYVRTIDPARVIDDPAMMLSFTGMVIAATLLFRRAAYRQHASRWIHLLWTGRVADWMYAKTTRPTSGQPEVRPTSSHRCPFAPPSIDTLVSAGRPAGRHAA